MNTIKEKFLPVVRDRQIVIMLRLTTLFWLISFIAIIWKWNMLPPELPLFYSIPRSPDQLGSPVILLMLPGFSLLFFSIDFILAALLYPREKLTSTLLVFIGTLVSFLLFVTLLKIITLVT